MKPVTKVLLVNNILAEARTLLDDLRQLKCSITLELDYLKEAREQEVAELREIKEEFAAEINKFRVTHQMNLELLSTIAGKGGGDENMKAVIGRNQNATNRFDTTKAS